MAVATPQTCKASSVAMQPLLQPAVGHSGGAPTRETIPERLARLITSPKAYARQRSLLAGLRWLRANLPFGRVESADFDPFWVVTRHADVSDIIRRHDLFHSGDRAHTLVPRASDDMARAMTGGSPHPIRTLVHMDEPDHSKYRAITQSWFTQERATSLEDSIRTIARASIERMAQHGPTCDFVRDIAIHYPLKVLMQILGVPQSDEKRMLKLTQELFASEDADLRHGEGAKGDPARHAKELFRLLGEFQAYFVPLMKRRRHDPKDDLASVIANARIDGKPIDHFEAVSYYVIVAAAGHDTTSSSISGGLWALCENPGEFRKAKDDPGLIPRLVEEAVRWTTPVHHVMRTATADVELRGQSVAKGDWIMLSYLSANRDEAAYDEPDCFRLRRNRSRSALFGQGVHTCLGQHLARLEMRIFFEELLARLASVEIAGAPRRSASIFIGGPKTLPIRFKMH
jgi:cytochrome P450